MKNTFTLLLLVLSIALAAQEKAVFYFEFNSDVPNDKSATSLEKFINHNPTSEIVALKGYCDSIDANDYNRLLSERRINSVLKTLREANLKISPTIIIEPFGEDFPMSANAAENRRVEVFYTSKKDAPKYENLADIGTELKMEPDVKEKILTAKKGARIAIHNINFFLNSEKIIPESMPVLDELYSILVKNPQLKIEIHGHICCNKNPNETSLSYRRAKAVFTYLFEKKINLNRLGYKGFGSSRPIFSIPEKTNGQRKANRRVEIEIKQPAI